MVFAEKKLHATTVALKSLLINLPSILLLDISNLAFSSNFANLLVSPFLKNTLAAACRIFLKYFTMFGEKSGQVSEIFVDKSTLKNSEFSRLFVIIWSNTFRKSSSSYKKS